MERRANLLAERLKARVDLMANMMRPGGRAIFHTRKSEVEALKFWRAHRYDELGEKVLSTWRPDQILKLDLRLAQANESEGTAVDPLA